MAIYVTLVRLTSEGQKTVSDLGKTWQEGVKKAEQMGIKTIGAYGLLGRYDMMFVYEAPNEKVAAGMPLSFTSRGTSQTETWTAIPMEELVKLTAKVKG